jgi:type VI secretion system protein ImpL
LQAFVVLNQYGYSVKQLDGYKLDITPRFIHYINSGINLLSAYKPEYQIKITTLPFDVNKDAKLEPNYVDLHLECAQSDTILKNENYTLSKTFHWIPGKCGDTTITFGFNTFSVQKVYKGPRGFLLFLKDFQDGTKVFSMKEYTKSAPELKQYNVKYVKVSYNISNEGNILKLLDKTPYNVPKTVTKEE